MTLPSLPTLDVYVAFNPTNSATLYTAPQQALPASGASNTYWTNVSAYVQDFQTKSGKQHFLDRMEAGTLQMTMNNRTGYFFNGGVSGNNSGYILASRMPIAVTATWSATTYNVFWGITDSVEERILDAVNVELNVQATDLTKYLSLRYMNIPSFWKTYATSTSAQSWYRCTPVNTATVTSASGSGTTITYQALNTLAAGQSVTVTGLPITTGKSLNLSHVAVASATSTSFTVTNSTVGTSVGATGTVYRTQILDMIGTNNGDYEGVIGFPTYGAIIYDRDGCVDLANGTGAPTGYMQFPAISTTAGGIDFWVLGQNLAGNGSGTTLTIVTSGASTLLLQVDASGHLVAHLSGGGVVSSSIVVNDGFWHHVGLVSDSGGYLHLYCDNSFFALTSLGTFTGFTAPTNLQIGTIGALSGNAAAYYDEIVVSGTGSLATIETEVQNRFKAGSLLQNPVNSTQSTVSSGDRIAQILCIAGFGTISGGNVSLNTGCYAINNGSAWVANTAGNGYINVEPYYWDTPITNMTALDLILQICDTDIGIFFQKPNGTFAFYNQSFYGTWVGPPTSTWTPNTYSPTGDQVWTDDDSGVAYIGPGLQVLRDDADVWTTVKITPQAGVEQVYENTAAEARWGATTLIKSSTVPPTLAAALSAATYLGHIFRSPLPRVGNVELRAETGNGAHIPALFDNPIGQVVTFKRTSPNASTTGTYPDVKAQINQLMVVESIAHDFQASAGTWHTSFVLDPYPVRS